MGIDVFGLFFDMLSTRVFTTRHWQSSGRLVQELTICTVGRLYAVSGLPLLLYKCVVL